MKNEKRFTSEYQPKQKWSEEKALQVGLDLIEWLNKKDEKGNDEGNIFFEEFLIIERDFYVDLPEYLKNKFKSFSDLLDKARKIQEIKLVKYGVGDRLNSTMTKFVLTNCHGWKEKTEQEIKTDNNNIPIINFIQSSKEENGN